MNYKLQGLALALGLSVAGQAAATCYGNVYSMNAGRGHVGMFLDIQDDKKVTTAYNGERSPLVSRALFSAAAMSYDEATNRTYYVSSPIPTRYHVTDYENSTTDAEQKSLDLHASQVEAIQLAYYDHATEQHVLAGQLAKELFRMAFNPATGELYASDRLKLYKLDVNTLALEEVGAFPSGVVVGGFTNWGDFIFHDNELLFVTNTRTYVVDPSTAALTVKAFHYTDFVTAATHDQNGQILIAAKNQNVNGNLNSTWLWRYKPSTGEKVSVGLYPARISALATNTQEAYKCYEETLFNSDLDADVTDVSASASTVNEGQSVTYTVTFDKALPKDTDVLLALTNGTATIGSDVNASVAINYVGVDGDTTATLTSDGASVSIPEDATAIEVTVTTLKTADFENAENFVFSAWTENNKSDQHSATTTITDTTETDLATYIKNQGVAWHGHGGNWVTGIYAFAVPPNLTVQFYANGSPIGSQKSTYGQTYNTTVYLSGPSVNTVMQFNTQLSATVRTPSGRTYTLGYGQYYQDNYNNRRVCVACR
ncbi:hypothetical protein [Enterovibrio baiacu]|uniref:hypothetical protein n=1 Tax=Enterovibrio baiacu TaxID=2491023 RepID=UPI001011CAB0|nr:hypothetical protein [Enterovibrio baiacu]MBE1274015.1 hypothetical protein [Enterovibrio baiacu]